VLTRIKIRNQQHREEHDDQDRGQETEEKSRYHK
jgi:hypothetical protein